MPFEQQQPGNVEAETQVFAKFPTHEPDEATIPGVEPVAAPPAPPAPKAVPAPAAAAAKPAPKSLTRRLARRILGPTLMTKR
ncbi:hypothetical protein [Lentzea sp. NBRC 102530]|uniref:hypothetical protein n=1 Tax=Lentzea sp. NBRC 102530 TaxID=3032201 RepID=UPI0024A20B89|nr:hypothetical protein [Lentzea sp. NBRC 102530]GLY50050.1 hypothetical protein Lesp01_37060 [Lentzea sp. NBRC 102530]